MSGLKILSERDYERYPPGFYDPKQRAFSLVKCMLIWVGINICIDVVVRVILLGGTSLGVYSKPWLLLTWMAVGAALWWVDKVHYMSWLSKRSESALRLVPRAGIEKGVQA